MITGLEIFAAAVLLLCWYAVWEYFWVYNKYPLRLAPFGFLISISLGAILPVALAVGIFIAAQAQELVAPPPQVLPCWMSECKLIGPTMPLDHMAITPEEHKQQSGPARPKPDCDKTPFAPGCAGQGTWETTEAHERREHSWHLLAQAYDGTVSLVKDLTKEECEKAKHLSNVVYQNCGNFPQNCSFFAQPSDIKSAECFQ